MTGIKKIHKWDAATGGLSGRHPKISIAFDQPTFDRLCAIAVERKEPFGAVVRHYVALGMRSEPLSMQEGA